MMIEESPYPKNMGHLIKDLDLVTEKLEEIGKKPHFPPNEEIQDLIHGIKQINQTLDHSFWEDKKLIPESLSASIEKALKAMQLFPFIKIRVGQRDVDQAIASLTSTLIAVLDDFYKNLKNLNEYKIGQKVEKTEKSKHS